MKKLSVLGLAAALLLCAPAFSQDFDFSDDFGSDFGGDFGDSSSSSAFSATALEISGEAELNFRAYVDEEDRFGKPVDEWDTEAEPKGKLNLKYANDSVSAEVKFAFSKDILENYKEDIIDELTLESYFGNFTVQAGKMKVVWGKGDKLHAIDNFNANDYTDFVVPDYIDRRIAEPMIRAVYNFPSDFGPFSSSRFEAVWTPFFTADRYASSGRWVPAQVSSLSSTLTGYGTEAISSTVKNLEETRVKLAAATVAYNNATGDDKATYAAAMQSYTNQLTEYNTLYLSQLNNSSSLADNLYPDTHQLKYMQAGARFTTTTGSLDWGISYYAGRDKSASIDYSKMNGFVTKYLAGTSDEDDKFIDYDFMQVFGLEFAKTFGAFNFRAEGAYNLTQDTAGDDPAVKNNSIAWVAGFDRDLPISEINVNVQGQGKHILKHDKIEDNAYDTQGGSEQHDIKLVVNISDSLAHGKVKPEVSAIYGIQHYDLIVVPKLTWYVSDGLEFSALGMYMASFDEEKTEFEGWHNNGFVQLGVKYTF